MTQGPARTSGDAAVRHRAAVTPAERAIAPRLEAPSWRDPRLVVGVLLVLGAVVAGGRLAAMASTTTAMWSAGSTVAAGDDLTPDDLVVVQVRLEDVGGRYLPADEPPPDGAVALRTVGAGELVPVSAVGDASELALTPLGLVVEGALPSGLVKGARVDVWLTPPASSATPATLPTAEDEAVTPGPELLTRGVEVFEVSSDEGAFAGSAGRTVSVLLDDEGITRALAARSAGFDVSVLLVPGTTPARR